MANRISFALRERISARVAARLFSTSPSSPFHLAADNAPPLVHPGVVLRRSPDALGLDDPQSLFASVPSSELLRAAFNLYLASCGPLVDVGSWFMSSTLMRIPVVRRAVKATVYEHFCAGEGVEEAGETLRRMWDRGLRGILDYGLEDAEGNEDCDRNLEQFLRTVEMTPSLPSSSVGPLSLFLCFSLSISLPHFPHLLLSFLFSIFCPSRGLVSSFLGPVVILLWQLIRTMWDQLDV